MPLIASCPICDQPMYAGEDVCRACREREQKQKEKAMKFRCQNYHVCKNYVHSANELCDDCKRQARILEHNILLSDPDADELRFTGDDKKPDERGRRK